MNSKKLNKISIRHKAFTLIEILLAICVAGLLTILSVRQGQHYIQQKNIAQLKSSIELAFNKLNAYYQLNCYDLYKSYQNPSNKSFALLWGTETQVTAKIDGAYFSQGLINPFYPNAAGGFNMSAINGYINAKQIPVSYEVVVSFPAKINGTQFNAIAGATQPTSTNFPNMTWVRYPRAFAKAAQTGLNQAVLNSQAFTNQQTIPPNVIQLPADATSARMACSSVEYLIKKSQNP